jgi:predicted AAA+ superfamily ATPase
LGASFEGFVVEQILSVYAPCEAYFWATHGGAELDLLLFKGGKRLGFEVKLGDVPSTSRSMRSALADLGLDHLYVVYPGEKSFPLDDRIDALSILELSEPECA